mgnify:CR=1 FL=1
MTIFRILLFAIVLILATLQFSACDRGNDGDDGPVFIPKELFEIRGDLSGLNEIPCLDSVPDHDPANTGAYGFAFEDSVFIEHIAMNPNNPDQWVFSKRYILKDQPYGIGTEAVYWTDLRTGICRLIDSSENLKTLLYGGDYVVMERNLTTLIYHTSLHVFKEFDGIQPSISPNGKWLKLYMYKDFSNQREDLINLPNFDVFRSWKHIGGIAPGKILWLDDNEFLFFRSKVYGDAYELRKHSLIDSNEIVEYSSSSSTFGGPPIIWVSQNEVLTSGGFSVDLEQNLEKWTYKRCKNKYFTDFIDIGKEYEFIGKKVYYRADHEERVVYYSHHFHLLKPDEGVEQRLELVFE